MKKPWVVFVDAKIWDRTVTQAGAVKVAAKLEAKGLKAAVAYEINKEVALEPMAAMSIFKFLNKRAF